MIFDIFEIVSGRFFLAFDGIRSPQLASDSFIPRCESVNFKIGFFAFQNWIFEFQDWIFGIFYRLHRILGGVSKRGVGKG